MRQVVRVLSFAPPVVALTGADSAKELKLGARFCVGCGTTVSEAAPADFKAKAEQAAKDRASIISAAEREAEAARQVRLLALFSE